MNDEMLEKENENELKNILKKNYPSTIWLLFQITDMVLFQNKTRE